MVKKLANPCTCPLRRATMKDMVRTDRNHHHPQVHFNNYRWIATCTCGWANWNHSNTWRAAFTAALQHSERLR